MRKPGITLGLVAVCILAGCCEAAQPTCRELFEAGYEANIEAFMQTMPDVDPVEARRRCGCMLEKLYEIDSTFVRMQGAEMERFIRENLPALGACDSIRQADR